MRHLGVRSRRTLAILLATVLAFGVVELALYTFGTTYDEVLTMADPVRGWRPRPNASGWMVEENRVWVQINSDGLRDRERTRAKPPHTFRVAVLGDSYMEALNVPLEETFTSHLETRLAACLSPAGVSADVINFGVVGYGTTQELLTYRLHASAYEPDVVITAIYFGNDVHDNHPELNNAPSPFLIADNGSLVMEGSLAARLHDALNQPRRIRLRQAITERSRAAMLLYQPWLTIRPLLIGETPAREEEEEENESWPDQVQTQRPPDAGTRLFEAWRNTDALLRELGREVQARGAEPWFITLSVAEQVDVDLSRREGARRALGVDDLFYAERRVSQLAATQGISTVTLAQPLADYAARHHVHLHGGLSRHTPGGQGHWNPTANRLAAGIVSERLCAESPALARYRDSR